jgi:plasmid maintenance system antidote protein VapI
MVKGQEGESQTRTPRNQDRQSFAGRNAATEGRKKMSQWMGRCGPGKPVDFAVLQESALAMAQATLENALASSGITRSELAQRMNRPRSFITRMMSGSHNLTIKTYALALAACDLEPRFEYAPLQWGWSQEAVVENACEVVPTYGGGQFNDDDCVRIVIELPIAAMAP